MAKGNSGKTKGQKREDLERKRDERARRRSMKKEREIKEYLQTDENFVSFKNQLEAIGLKIKDILGDGNCLFRALGDQLNGDHTAHAYHRKKTIQYMKEHREDFEPFMEDGVTFEKHLKELSKLGTYGGNDSIVAFARSNGLDIVIHQLNNPRWVIHGGEYSKTPEIIELHLAYHNGEHYSSVRRLTDPGDGPAWQFNKKQKNDENLNDTSLKTDTKIRKKKDLKKKCKTFEQGTSSSSTENGQTLEQVVMSATGCKHVKLVTETLEENLFDVDASIGYILQLMTVMGDQDCLPSSDTALSKSHISSADVAEKEISFTSEETSIKDTNSSISENHNENTLGNHGDITDKTDWSTASLNNSMCEEQKINTVALNEFVDDLRDSHTEIKVNKEQSENIMIKQGARPKENTQKNSLKVTPHLSNRQRKEQAKQEKKKRREETRKEDQEDSIRNNADLDNHLGSLVADLGAVCI